MVVHHTTKRRRKQSHGTSVAGATTRLSTVSGESDYALRRMSAGETKPWLSGPFDAKRVGKIINDRRIELGLEVKQILPEIGWDKGEYSRKTRGLTPLWLWECSRLAVILKGWYGFPFVDKNEGTALEAFRDRLPEILQYLATHPRSTK